MTVQPTTDTSYDYDTALRRRLSMIQDNATSYNNNFIALQQQKAQAQQQSQTQQTQQWVNQANSDATGIGSRLVQEASKLNGIPYKWGGESVSGGFDCSGLVQYVYGKMGIKVPRTAAQQASTMGTVTNINNLRPGDLVAWGSSPATAHHIAIYAGNGMIWEAPHTGANIRYTKISGSDVFGISVRYQ